MRFDLDTLDSGERSLPFGLLVCKTHCELEMVKYICFPGICFHVAVHLPGIVCHRDGNRPNAKAVVFSIANTPQSYPFRCC